MGHSRGTHLFGELVYQKTVAEVVTKIAELITAFEARSAEREGRIVRIRADFSIADHELIQLLAQAAADPRRDGSNTAFTIRNAAGETRVVAAGVVQNLLTEQNLIESEREAVRRLRLIGRNLRPIQRFAENGQAYTEDSVLLSEAELEFLGF